jgi:glycosyltransferase involved in cell wall biosynthesis
LPLLVQRDHCLILKNIIFINSHPIQYFAPLYKYLNQHEVPTACWYCSNETLTGHHDRQFNAEVKWDVPVLDGYPFRFFKNYSLRPSFYHGFFGLINLGMIAELFRQPPSIIIVHGWAYCSHVLVLLFGRLAGHTICLRGETPLNQEVAKGIRNQLTKKIILKQFLFRFVHWFMFIGRQNNLFYRYLGVNESKLLFTPYAVDNDRFQLAARQWIHQKPTLRKELGLPQHARIILFVGKYIQKKRPLDILAAYEKLSLPDVCLVMVGEGELRMEMENFIREHSLNQVYLTGFVNQKDIEKYYAVADIFVMCSGEGETWGLSVNEAMNFGLPIVVSDMTGCAFDLVVDGKNGFVFKTGDVDGLALRLEMAFQLTVTDGTELIKRYSFSSILSALKSEFT